MAVGGQWSVVVLCDVFLLLVLLFAFVGNSLVLLVFATRPGLRTLSNRFVVNLVGTNLLACCTLLPLVVADNLRESSDQIVCILSESITTTICSASILAVLLIAVDQYCAVVDPLHYHTKINKSRSGGMIASTWTVSLLLGALGGTMAADGLSSSSMWSSCQVSSTNVTAFTPYRKAFASTFFILIFIIPFASITWIYMCIYSEAHSNSKRARKTGSGSIMVVPDIQDYSPIPTPMQSMDSEVACPATTTITFSAVPSNKVLTTSVVNEMEAPPSNPTSVTVTVTPPVSPPQGTSPCRAASIKSTSSSLVNSLRYRISNASVFKYREETRAARISALVIVMGLVCWFPYCAVFLLHSGIISSSSLAIPRRVDIVCLTLLASGAFVAPCLFAFRNRRIQREVRKLLGLQKRSKNLSSFEETANRKSGVPRTIRPTKTDYTQTAVETLTILSAKSKSIEEFQDCQHHEYNIFEDEPSLLDSFLNRTKWTKISKVGRTCDCLAMPDCALSVDTCRSSFSSGASTQCTTSSLDTALDD